MDTILNYIGRFSACNNFSGFKLSKPLFPSVILTFIFLGGGDDDNGDDDENGTDNDNDDDTTFAFEHVPPMIKLQKQSMQIGSLTSARVASQPSLVS